MNLETRSVREEVDATIPNKVNHTNLPVTIQSGGDHKVIDNDVKIERKITDVGETNSLER